MKKTMGVLVLMLSTLAGPDAMSGQGWTLVTEQDTNSLITQIRIVVRSGSLSDPSGMPGLANFTARALLRGTKTRPYKDLTDSIERIGASLSVSVDQDQTVLAGAVLTKNLDFFLDILRDMLTQPAFDVREIVTLQGIIQGELKSRLQEPKALAKRAAIKRAYRGTSAEGFVLGTIDSVSHIRPIDADRFFKARYVRENMVIGVVSPFSDREVVAKIESKLDTVLSGVLDASRLPEVAVAGTGRHAVIVDRKGMATTPVYIVIPGVGDADPDISTLELGNFVFGADFTSRLIQVLRAENGWTYGAYSGFQQLIGAKAAPALFSIYTFPSVEYASLAIPKAVSMLEDYASLGVSESEFQDARDALGNRYAFEMDSAEKRLALKMRQALSGRPFLRPEEYRQGLAQLDKFILNQVILRRTLVSDMVIAAVGDPALLKPILSALPFVKSVEVLDIIP